MNRESLNKFYHTYRLYIFPLVIILSCLILIVLVIYPQINQLISSRNVEKDLRQKVEFLEVKAQNLEEFDAEVLSQRVSYVLNAYPQERDFANVIGLIPALAAGSGFNIGSLSFSSAQAEGKNYRVTADVRGPGSLISTLINNIEGSTRLMKVNSLEISAGKAGSDEVTASLNIEVLYASLPKDFGTVETPLPEFSTDDEKIIAKLAVSAPSVAETTAVSSVPKGKANPFE